MKQPGVEILCCFFFFIDGQILIISGLRAGFNRQFIRALLVFMVTFWN